MTHLLTVVLMMGDQTGGKGGSPFGMIIPLVLIVVVFYFFMIRPQTKRTKEAKKFREGLKKGDKVITIGGIHGKIVETQDTTFTIETEGQGRLRIEKSAVASGTSNPELLGENK
jgi:preprotein translocase subunit YajC